MTESVDINIQDLNRNNNTALYLATWQFDKKRVRLLNKYNPDLQIRNGSDRTSFDVAQRHKVVKLGNRYYWRASEFKVLKITCCPRVQIVYGRN